MLETQFFGKLLPTQPDIKPILLEIREKYQIPEINPEDNGLRVLLKYHLEIDWAAVHAEILQRLTDHPDLLPESMMKAYRAYNMFTQKGIVDPELKKVSPKFRQAVKTMASTVFKVYEPTAEQIDKAFVT
jgi:hypothetical protein